MPVPPLSEDLAREAVEAFLRHGSKADAAKALGLKRTTFCKRLAIAAKRGLLGTRPVLPGFAIKRTSTQTGPNGELQREWVQQEPESGTEFEIPDGQTIKGVSALVDGDGRIKQQWIKTAARPSIDDIIPVIKEAFDGYKGRAEICLPPSLVDDDLLTVYIIADLHLGLYAWAKECGDDYNIDIASKLLKDAMRELVSRSHPSGTAIVLNLGDFFHADDTRNRTPRAGNVLDVDTRYAKILRLGVDLRIWGIELALQKHNHIIVRDLPGNHDEHITIALSIALSCFFASNDRVTVDCDPSLFWCHQFGRVMLAAHHGHEVKPENMPGVMAANWSEIWGATDHRFAYLGHVHHASSGERNGASWETFQTLSAKDAWAAGKGYNSGRSMAAIFHHREDGYMGRHYSRPLPKKLKV